MNLPTFLVEHNTYENQEMTTLELERPIARQCRRVATLWFRWVESPMMVYLWGVEGTWTQIWELVTIMPTTEIAHPNYLAQLLAPPLPPPAGVLFPQPLATAGFRSESSNSVTGPVRREDEEWISDVCMDASVCLQTCLILYLFVRVPYNRVNNGMFLCVICYVYVIYMTYVILVTLDSDVSRLDCN